jgi:hypothetical protein
MADANYNLVMAFPDQSQNFAYGFACGRIWQGMADEKTIVLATVPDETRSTIEAMAMARGWTEEITDIGSGWLEVRLTNPLAADRPHEGENE